MINWTIQELDGCAVYRIPQDTPREEIDVDVLAIESNRISLEETLQMGDRLLFADVLGWRCATITKRNEDFFFADDGGNLWAIKKSKQQDCWVVAYGMNKGILSKSLEE